MNSNAATPTSDTCNSNSVTPAGSALQGCISPYPGTGTSAFGVANSTSNTLYGPRQLQISGKLVF